MTKTARGAIKKKEFSLGDYKKDKGVSDNIPEKELKWIPLSPAFQQETGLIGIPMGRTTLSRGFSNVGKSTVLFECAVSCQQNGILPIIIDTENNVSRSHLEAMGFDWESDFYLLIDNDYLLENFGKKKDAKLNDASIEDVAEFIHKMIDDQESGKLPYDLCFIWDSIGSLDSRKVILASVNDTSDNNMWNAASLEKSFKGLLNNRIPASSKATKPYTNTFVAVQKIWLDNMGMGVVKHKGGEAFWYGARLIIHFGGTKSNGVKNLEATKDKKDVAFGIETKVHVVKNQINGISLKGKLGSVPHGFILTDKNSLDEYKKVHLKYFRDTLGIEGDFTISKSVSDDDIVEELEG